MFARDGWERRGKCSSVRVELINVERDGNKNFFSEFKVIFLTARVKLHSNVLLSTLV